MQRVPMHADAMQCKALRHIMNRPLCVKISEHTCSVQMSTASVKLYSLFSYQLLILNIDSLIWLVAMRMIVVGGSGTKFCL